MVVAVAVVVVVAVVVSVVVARVLRRAVASSTRCGDGLQVYLRLWCSTNRLVTTVSDLCGSFLAPTHGTSVRLLRCDIAFGVIYVCAVAGETSRDSEEARNSRYRRTRRERGRRGGVTQVGGGGSKCRSRWNGDSDESSRCIFFTVRHCPLLLATT